MIIAMRMVMMMRDEKPSVRFLLLMSIAIWVDHHLKRRKFQMGLLSKYGVVSLCAKVLVRVMVSACVTQRAKGGLNLEVRAWSPP